MKAFTLRALSKTQLLAKLETLQGELVNCKVQQLQKKQPRLKQTRKDIARVKTVLSQTTRQQLKIFYKGKRTPLDLRVKKTRAIRRRLTPFEQSKTTLRQQKKLVKPLKFCLAQ